MKYYLLFSLITYTIYGSERTHLAFVPFDREKFPEIKSEKVIEMGRYRTQDSISNCYALSMAKRLEYFCRTKKDCDLQNDEISPLYLDQKYNGGILVNSKGGNGKITLEKLGHNANQDLFLVKESCAPFDQTLHRTVNKTNPRLVSTTHQNGLFYLEEIYNKVRSGDCEDCSSSQLAEQVKSNLVNFDRDLKEIETILNRAKGSSIEDFLTELLIPYECRSQKSNQIKLPPFTYHGLSSLDLPTPQSVVDKIKELLDQNIPPELSLCDGKKNKDAKRVCGEHAVIVNGYRYRCNSGSCNYEFKIHNSWGKSWQDNNNDGWVDALTLGQFGLEEPINETQTKSRGGIADFVNWFAASAPVIETKKEAPPVPTPTKIEKKAPAKSTDIWICIKSKSNKKLTSEREQMLSYSNKGYACRLSNF